MLISYVQAAPNATPGSYHIQATGPAFPAGYSSGDTELSVKTRTVFVPSMRGSGREYFVLTPDEIEANLAAIVKALGAPRPAYSQGDTTSVQARIKKSLAIAEAGEPKPQVATKCDISEAQIEKIVRAVVAALKS